MTFNVLNGGEALTESTRNVMSVIRKHGPLPRSAMTAHLNLSQQSVHRIVDSLLDQNLLQLLEPTISGRGKPSPRVAINPATHLSFGLSIGTETAKACALDLTGQPLFEHDLEAHPNRQDAVRDEFARVATDWLSASKTPLTVVGAGIAMQGYRQGRPDVFYPPNPLENWRDIPTDSFFGDALNVPTFSENNATSSAIAEYYLGLGAQFASIAYLSFNFGFGSGLVVHGNPDTGAHGNAGEISSIFIKDQIRSRPALEGLLRSLTDASDPTPRQLQDILPSLDLSDTRVGDWLGRVAPQLQLALRALKSIADPSAIAFGGEAPHDLRLALIGAAQGAFGAQLTPNPALLPSKLEGDPSHLGAAFLPLHRLVF